jgi:hypothetical protein
MKYVVTKEQVVECCHYYYWTDTLPKDWKPSSADIRRMCYALERFVDMIGEPAAVPESVPDMWNAVGDTYSGDTTMLEIACKNDGWNAFREAFLSSDSIRSFVSITSDPSGWKLVPVEPTIEMMRAADKLPENFSIGDEWKAMLSAAPNHPTTEKGCD